MRGIADTVDGLKSLKTGEVYCYRFSGSGMNKDTDLSKLTTDLQFEFKPQPEAK